MRKLIAQCSQSVHECKSGYVNTAIFMRWLSRHFISQKQQGKVVLLLDGYISHCTDLDILGRAQENDVIMVCLSPNSTHYLQPLDWCFFKPLKHFFYKALHISTQSHPGHKARTCFTPFLKEAWQKVVTQANAHSGFEVCGIYPHNPAQIPDEAFSVSDAAWLCQLLTQISWNILKSQTVFLP
ncbi:hypothetical protein Cfor_02007 [Coptotermes formosanus]|uniref:DDE-1 domain-containing protein n=1 Tax=Coptotermes formosanus TaxID=36987 RepID=A0A6L2P962_COPFO|nr:hypothetical protein Cfor_02007 [Coptotermes formosanus]